MQFELCLKNHTLPSSQDSAASPEVKQSPKPAEETESSVAGPRKRSRKEYYQKNKERIKELTRTRWRLLNPNYDKTIRTKVSPAVDKEHILRNIIKDPVTGCWNWQKCISEVGYGTLREFGKLLLVHRKAYEIWTGTTIPKGMLGCHKCDNRKCCNPEHIFIGTYRDNMQDASRKRRLVPRSRQLSDEQVIAIRADPDLHRVIAAKYGIRPGTVSEVKRRTKYRGVP